MAIQKPASQQSGLPRRRFIQDITVAGAVMYLSPGSLMSCSARRNNTSFFAADVDVMDQALEMMNGLAQLTNHGPMAAEALVALGRADKVEAFVEAYKKRFTSPYPATVKPITQQNWREALGDGRRVADWTNFFRTELKEAKWSQVLEKWCEILAPGLTAAAGHGLIRTGHAVRSLSVKETSWRLHELAEGLGYWAAYYQTLPEVPNPKAQKFKPADAISRIPPLPTEIRPSNGSIMIGLRSLNDFSSFAAAADLIGVNNDSTRLISEMTETFADAYVKNVTQRNFVTLIHTVTSTTAVRTLLPYLSRATAQEMLRYGWQLAAALYSISSIGSTNITPEPKEIKRDDLIDRAATLQEEHAIKFTEACLREYALNPSPAYLQAAHDALGRLTKPA